MPRSSRLLYSDPSKTCAAWQNQVLTGCDLGEIGLAVSFAHPTAIKDIGCSVLKYRALTLYVGMTHSI